MNNNSDARRPRFGHPWYISSFGPMQNLQTKGLFSVQHNLRRPSSTETCSYVSINNICGCVRRAKRQF